MENFSEGPTRGKKQHRDEEGGHVMISYQWGNQKTLIDVRNELRKNGFKVIRRVLMRLTMRFRANKTCLSPQAIFLLTITLRKHAYSNI